MIQKQDELKKQMKNMQQIRVNKIIPKAYTRQLELVDYLIVSIQAKHASKVIEAFKKYEYQNQIQKQKDKQREKYDNPFSNQREKEKPFLKRVKKVDAYQTDVLVCKMNDPDKENLIKAIEKLDIIQKVYEIKLPNSAPLTKQQFQEWSKLWPINFIQQEISKQIVHSTVELEILRKIKCSIADNTGHFFLLDGIKLDILYNVTGCCEEGTIDHPIMKLLKCWPLSQVFNADPDKYYYLTRLKMFVAKPICGMCSMALVHSRLYSIYMDFQPTQIMDSIFGCPKLNHQIIMFKIT